MMGLAVAGLLGFAGCKKATPEHDATPAASASEPAARLPPNELRLVVLPPRVGDRIHVSRKSRVDLAIEFWQDGKKIGTSESKRSEEYAQTVEVLGLIGAASAKIRVRYDQYHLMETHPDKPPRDESHLAGHTYVLDAAEGPLRILGDNGKAVTPLEDETLQKLHGDLGREDPVVAALGDRPIAVGRTAPMHDALFRALVSAGTGEFKGGTFVLSRLAGEAGRDAAIFDWSAEMRTQEDSGLEITWHLKGQAIVGVSPAETLRTTVDGALDASGQTTEGGARVDIAGDGSFKDELAISPISH